MLTREENERLNNVRRLAVCLYQCSDPRTLKQLAHILHYIPEQLKEDILDLEKYTYEKTEADRKALHDEENEDENF